MPEQIRNNELQEVYRQQYEKWFKESYTIRETVDIFKLYDLLQSPECPAWRWFPNNEEMKKLAEYLVKNGVTTKDEE